jgi:opacity protein-like surface antigen
MKKAVLSVLLVFLPLSAFSADFSLSAGGGGLFGYTFTRYTLKEGDTLSLQRMDRINYSGFLFFDATYAEFSVSILSGKNNYSESIANGADTLRESSGTGSETNLGLSLLGKYPFTISEKFTWFPIFGLEYNIALVQTRSPDDGREYDRSKGKGVSTTDVDKDGNSYPLSAFSAFWIDVGAGLDYNLTDSLFLRGELLFGFRLPTGYELGALEMAKKALSLKDPSLAGLTGGPNLKIALGYRF